MYKKRGANLNIKDVLSRLNASCSSTCNYTPVVYATSDIVAAKNVLNSLLAKINRSQELRQVEA